MTQRNFLVQMEWDEESQVWVTYVPELGGISTYGDTEEEALEATRELIQGYIEASMKDEESSEPHHHRKLVEVELAV